jgi:threonylcarbamoyladenosine tRNA methylthiotransferase MtaB
MSRVSFYTLGCKLNYAETSTLERAFEERSYSVVPFGDPADVTVVNTCSVTSESDRKCRNIIRRALRANPDSFVVVTGCYAQLQPREIAEIEGVDIVLGAGEKFRLFQYVKEFTKQEETQISVSCIDDVTEYGPAFSSGDRTRAFLKVQDGCDYSCSFCTIPLARGGSRSQSVSAIVSQANEIAARGFKEIVLSGVNIGLYGADHGSTLIVLLRALDGVDGIERYRISSIEPNLLTNEIVDFVGSSSRFQPHFHIPLQSGDDQILGKMRRRYTRNVYADRVEYVKSLMPDACIGVDVIVGFPGEDEARFANTCEFIDALPVSYLHVFTYSERADTAAVKNVDRMGGDSIPKPERSRRNRTLRILSKKKEHAFYRAFLGDVRPVLWEGASKSNAMFGYTDNYVRVEAPFDPQREGHIEPVALERLTEHGTVAAADAGFVPLN